MSTKDDQIAVVNQMLKDIKSAKSGSEVSKALVTLLRHGKSMTDKDLNIIIACGCGPSGERGIESGLCST